MMRDKSFTLKFLDQFQDKLMFGADSCKRSDVNREYPNISFIREPERTKNCSTEALEKIKWKNCC